MDLSECVVYRLAFGLADQFLEAKVHMGTDRYRNNPAAGGDLETIVAEILRRLAIVDHVGEELVRDAVGDVIEGRRPRW
jgi:hypothetical protein